MVSKSQINQLWVITLIWVVAGLLTALYEYFFLANYPGILESGTMEEYSLGRNILTAMAGLFVGSLLYGALEIFFFQRKAKREKFWKAITKKFLTYTFLMLLLLFGISLFFNSLLSDRGLADPAAWNKSRSFILSPAILHPAIPILILVLFTSFFLQLSERFGTNELWKMFSGKYFNPKEESRIFMFLDLNASTTLAEKLGNKKFYSFLNDFYHDIAPVIQAFKGDVVEYVGDQVVITWSITGGAYHARCMACYKEFEKVIQNRKTYYLHTYGLIPTFKAAIHCGAVMIGEMGKLKKSIK